MLLDDIFMLRMDDIYVKSASDTFCLSFCLILDERNRNYLSEKTFFTLEIINFVVKLYKHADDFHVLLSLVPYVDKFAEEIWKVSRLF